MNSCCYYNLLRNRTGALSPVTIVPFASITLTTATAPDLVRQKSERANPREALNPDLLATAVLSQRVKAEPVVSKPVVRS